MKTLQTIYYHIDGTPTKENADIIGSKDNYVKATCYYSEGGFSYFTYKQTPRAYFLSVQTVTRAKAGEAGTMEKLTMFNNYGYKEMIGDPVTRQSKNKEREAILYFNANIDNLVKESFQGVTLTKEV